MRDRRNTTLSISSDGLMNSPNMEAMSSSPSEKSYWTHIPPSPTLPLPVTKENYKPKRSNRRVLALKLVALLCLLVLLSQCIIRWKAVSSSTRSTGVDATLSQSDLIGSYDLPHHPTALIVADATGSSKWTISIPHSRRFPLAGREYHDMCAHAEMLRAQLPEQSTSSKVKQWLQTDPYSRPDDTFLQIDEAVKAGALPRSRRENLSNVCDKSLTFVFGRDDASFGKSLLLLWMSYGLSKKEGRAFFIDDSQWAWGKYASYFLPAPSPRCMQPPPHHIVPCPHSAKHLVVSSATAEWTFGPDFNARFASPKGRGVAKPSRIYELLRTGYVELFQLADEDHHYVSERVTQLEAEADAQQGPVLGLQVRRGDLHPFEYQYSMDYLPLERYADGIRSYMHRHYPNTEPSSLAQYAGLPLVLASDDPEILTSTELHLAVAPLHIRHAQDRILLATKATLDKSLPAPAAPDSDSAYVKHVDENAGWEGGFYSSLFHSLGGSRSSDLELALTDNALQLRQFVGRAYLMDLAVLSHSDGVICAVSSASCRALAVMMGWDALKQGRWVNVDDNRRWSWDGRKL